MSVHTSSVHTFVDLIPNIMSSHIIMIEPDHAIVLLISHDLEQSRTISLNLMSPESYCLDYSLWSHDTIVLDPMRVSLITCDLGVSRAISRNLVMIETCFASFVHQHYSCEFNSIVTLHVHITCVSRLVISLYLAVSRSVRVYFYPVWPRTGNAAVKIVPEFGDVILTPRNMIFSALEF